MYVDDVRESINSLLSLQASSAMQNTGDIFDGTKTIIENKTGTVCRKEQFAPKDSLPCELIVQDRRYIQDGIKFLHKKLGLLLTNSITVKQKNRCSAYNYRCHSKRDFYNSS